jgi:2-polyprenyl-3-methyl-5-hydroxy-6-metoxy-1,4-benzoquinol methylase
MKKYLKALYDIFKNYHFYSIPLLVNEVIFNFRYNSAFNKFKYLNGDLSSDSIPCSYFFLKKIKKFIIKNHIKFSCDLGSGYGKIIYYLGVLNNFKIDGVELENEIYRESAKLINNNINIYNENILKFDLSNIKYDFFIINDPLKKIENLSELVLKIKKYYKNGYLVFINLNEEKLSFVLKNLKILDSLIITKSRNILFCSID